MNYCRRLSRCVAGGPRRLRPSGEHDFSAWHPGVPLRSTPGKVPSPSGRGGLQGPRSGGCAALRPRQSTVALRAKSWRPLRCTPGQISSPSGRNPGVRFAALPAKYRRPPGEIRVNVLSEAASAWGQGRCPRNGGVNLEPAARARPADSAPPSTCTQRRRKSGTGRMGESLVD